MIDVLPITSCQSVISIFTVHMSFGVKGGPEGMELRGFDDAMLDSSTGLTHAALTGERKQSVGDAERMLSFLVANSWEKMDTSGRPTTLTLLLVGMRQRIDEG